MSNKRNHKLKALFAVAILLGSIPVYSQTQAPNIIYILTDDMGYSDISCFGGQFVPTPNIDRIAKNGRKFTHYYSAAPICSPSRAGLLTGMYPGRWNFSTYLDNKKHNRRISLIQQLHPSHTSLKRPDMQQAISASGILVEEEM